MSGRGLSALLKAGEFLICYDYGTGGLWGILVAPSAAAIGAKYPELVIVYSLPEWMDEAQLATMRETPLWRDEEPRQGLLRALVADRQRE